MDRPISFERRSVDLATEPAFQLGRARIDPQAHEYRIDGVATRVQPQTLKVLVALHDKRGEVVTREELIDRCWSGRIVGDDVINRCISLLRPVARESGGFTIETIPRAGYRLVEAATKRSFKPTPSAWAIGGAIATLALVVVGAGLATTARSANAQALVEVQPLNAAADDRSALALGEGMGAAIERDLAGSRTPVQIVDHSADNAASLVVRGSSIDDDGQLRASLQLVAGRSGQIVWAYNFARPANQLDQMQDQLSLQVAREIHCAYSDGRKPYFDADIEFAKLSLAHCDTIGRDPVESTRLDAQIVQRAPGFARGWAEYAIDTAFVAETLPPTLKAADQQRALAFARRALALDPHQGLAYAGIGVVVRDRWSWADRERLARRAIAADPRSPESHNWRSGLFGEIGRLQDALDEAQTSYQLDHFLPGKIDQLIRINIALGYFEDAEDELALARRYWPTHPWLDSDTVLLGVAGDRPAYALQLLTSGRVRTTPARGRMLTAFLRWRVAPSGATRTAAAEAIQAASRSDGPTGEQAQLLARLGEIDAAYALANEVPSAANGDARWLEPDLAAFRADPRFMRFAARFGLPQIWLQTGLWPDFCTTAGQIAACRAAAIAAVGAKPGVRPKRSA